MNGSFWWNFNLVVKHSPVFFWLVCTLFLRKTRTKYRSEHNECNEAEQEEFCFLLLLFILKIQALLKEKNSLKKVTYVLSLAPNHSIIVSGMPYFSFLEMLRKIRTPVCTLGWAIVHILTKSSLKNYNHCVNKQYNLNNVSKEDQKRYD